MRALRVIIPDKAQANLIVSAGGVAAVGFPAYIPECLDRDERLTFGHPSVLNDSMFGVYLRQMH